MQLLCERETQGINVQLSITDDRLLTVVVKDVAKKNTFVLTTRDGKEAMDMFRHPYVYELSQ